MLEATTLVSRCMANKKKNTGFKMGLELKSLIMLVVLLGGLFVVIKLVQMQLSFSSKAGLALPNCGFVGLWGEQGQEDGKLFNPKDLAVGDADYVYVVDQGDRVQKFTRGGQFVARWGERGTGKGQFFQPTGVVYAGGNVYVADSMNNRVQKMTTDGRVVMTFGSSGTGNGQFSGLVNLAVDTTRGFIYALDMNHHRVEQFDMSGTYVRQWGSYGQNEGQFILPRGIAVDGQGNVYVTDVGQFAHPTSRVQKFTWQGMFLKSWGGYGEELGKFKNPMDVSIDRNDNVFVVDTNNHRIQEFSTNGVFKNVYGEAGSGQGQYQAPQGSGASGPSTVATNTMKDYFVVDTNNNRVQRYLCK
jgi:tripartite motif-containing protein 71